MSNLKTLSGLNGLADLLGKPKSASGCVKVEMLVYDLRNAVSDLTEQFANDKNKGWLKASADDIATSYRQLGVLVRAIERE